MSPDLFQAVAIAAVFAVCIVVIVAFVLVGTAFAFHVQGVHRKRAAQRRRSSRGGFVR